MPAIRATGPTPTTVLVLAKEPRPGRVKTRLCPPCSPIQAADLAAAALADTLAAACACSADRVVLALDGEVGPWCPPGVAVVDQVAGPFARRLDAAWAEVDGPTVQIGMDTPQVTAGILDTALGTVTSGDDADALLGPALDGGWWLLGLRRSGAGLGLFDGVPMSTPETGSAQRSRLEELGYSVREAPALRDVDEIGDATEVARAAPDTRFARAVAALQTGPLGQVGV